MAKLTNEEKREILKLYKEGNSAKKIGVAINRSWSTCLKVVRDAGLDKNALNKEIWWWAEFEYDKAYMAKLNKPAPCRIFWRLDPEERQIWYDKVKDGIIEKKKKYMEEIGYENI